MTTQAKNEWESVIGLEIHAQLSTKSKLFCASSTEFNAPANSHVGPVDAGLPGVLPVLNSEAVRLAVTAGLALNCQIHEISIWSRKHYFYPDLPKGYQISQYDRPLCTAGFVELATAEGTTRRVGIHRIHMEEDAGKNLHEATGTLVNLNRAGIPLVEIVSEPDMRSAQEAALYMKKIRSILRYALICDGNMEEGSLRCDVNVSVRKKGQEKFGTKVELKNINSFRFVERAIEYEVQRQVEVLESGGTIQQETRSFDSQKGTTSTMRLKEDAQDYRYFPDPDLPPLRVKRELIEKIRSQLPELPDQKQKRFVDQYGLPVYDAQVLTSFKALSDYFENVCQVVNNPKLVSNWIMTSVLRDISDELESMSHFPISHERFAGLLRLIQDNVISGKIAKTLYDEMLKSKKSASDLVQEKGLSQISDTGALQGEIEKVLTEFPQETADYLKGKEKLIGFFVGEVMKRTRGKANPPMVQGLLKAALDKRKGN